MKELSIEQKAKRYDKALEKSKRLYEQGTITESLAYIFPELKESEDERIRKEIVTYLKSVITNKGYKDIIIESWIAWLEKQYADPIKEYWRGYNEGKQNVLDKYSELEKQGEKLPVGFYYVNSEGKKFYSDTFKYGDVILHVEKQGEQKPAWSEEDEEKFRDG